MISCKGRFLTINDATKNRLTLTLTPEGREEVWDYLEGGGNKSRQLTVHDLLEDHLGNGWYLIRAEDIGALTSCDLILAYDVETDETGVYTYIGDLWWHERYQIEDPIKVLLETGKLELTYVSDGTGFAATL